MSEIAEQKSGYLSLRLKKEECLYITTSDGPIEIRIRDNEKRPIVTRVAIKATHKVQIDTVLQTRPAIEVLKK